MFILWNVFGVVFVCHNNIYFMGYIWYCVWVSTLQCQSTTVFARGHGRINSTYRQSYPHGIGGRWYCLRDWHMFWWRQENTMSHGHGIWTLTRLQHGFDVVAWSYGEERWWLINSKFVTQWLHHNQRHRVLNIFIVIDFSVSRGLIQCDKLSISMLFQTFT